MSGRLGRLKRAVIRVVSLCGHIDGAAATAGKSRTLAGNWNNLNLPDTPVLTDCVALDEAALIERGECPILAAYAQELGHVALRLPDVSGAEAELGGQVLVIVKEVGDVSGAMHAALSDRETPGKLSKGEAVDLDLQFSELIEAATKGRALLRRQHGLEEAPRIQVQIKREGER